MPNTLEVFCHFRLVFFYHLWKLTVTRSLSCFYGIDCRERQLEINLQHAMSVQGINVNIGSDPSSDFGDYEQVHDKTSGYQSGLEIEEGYVSIFVRMLSLNNPVEDREAGVLALWRHSAAGADKVKEIVMFPGCLNLVVALLPSEREATAEAAAGLLRNISAIEEYR